MPEKIIQEAKELCEKFINKVETGRARSRETYSECKALLKIINANTLSYTSDENVDAETIRTTRFMELCKTCIFWKPFSDAYPSEAKEFSSHKQRAGGICQSKKWVEKDYGDVYEADMMVYPYAEGGHFWTGAEFGCVHHEKRK